MDGKVTIGTVKYLNAWPLTCGLADRPDVVLRAEVPSALPGLLRAGEVDVALAPSIEYFRLVAEGHERARAGGPAGFVALPVASIASHGAVGSVRLFGFVEPDKLRRVLLDPASRTSNTLPRVLVIRQLKCRPHFVLPQDAGPGSHRPPDAELVIGDRALAERRGDAQWELDLGREWNRMVHRPFVYAFWVARSDGPLERLTDLLSEARDLGLAQREALARRGAAQIGIAPEAAVQYLTQQIHYDFGRKQQDGLRAFYRMAAEEGLAPEGVRLRLYQAAGDGP